MATATITHARASWPFMASLNEAREIDPEAWRLLSQVMQRRASPKHETMLCLLREYIEQDAERRRLGQAAIQQAVNTLLSKHTN
jgi:hypothetical protein